MVIKVPSSNVRADMCSPDSLSLTSLVHTPQQHSSKSPYRKATKVSENDINFEFSYSAQSPAILHKKSPSSDLFDLKLSQQSPLPGNITMRDVLEPRKGSRQPARNKETRSTTKKMTNQVEDHGGFAHKLMQSITTPCRSCSAVEPSAAVKRTNAV